MSVQSQEYHSLIFNDGTTSKNTWDDWHLIPSARPVVERPTAASKYVEIPGRAGSLDLTDYLTSEPVYSDITGTFEMIVANDYGNWADRKQTIATFLNGRRMKMYLEDDPNYYYHGRIYFKKWTPGASNSTVTIEYRVDPWKYDSQGRKIVT